MDEYSKMEYENKKKSMLIAYLLWWFLGFVAAHRIYAEKPFGLFLGLWIVAIILSFFLVGIILVIPMAIWTLIDGIFLHKWINEYNEKLLLEYKNSNSQEVES